MTKKIIVFYIIVVIGAYYNVKAKGIFFMLYLFLYYNMKTYYYDVIADWSF